MKKRFTITAIDLNSSDTMNRTFVVNGNSTDDMTQLTRDIEQFDKDIPYRRYELLSDPFINEDDLTDEIREVFSNLDVTF